MEILINLIKGLLLDGVSGLGSKGIKSLKKSKIFKFRKAKKRIKEAEVVTFYYDRKVLQSDAGTIGDYVNKANNSVVYVGFWLSSSLGAQDLAKAIREAVERGVMIEFCLLSPNSQVVKFYETYFDLTSEEIVHRIQMSIEQLQKIQNDLPPHLKRRLKLYEHEELITSSFWAVDRDDPKKCLIQIDHKIIANPRFSSYGFEIEKTSAQNAFAAAFINGYITVLTRAKEIL